MHFLFSFLVSFLSVGAQIPNEDINEEEVQLIEEEEFDEMDEEGQNDESELEIDQEKMDDYEQEVEERTP